MGYLIKNKGVTFYWVKHTRVLELDICPIDPLPPAHLFETLLAYRDATTFNTRNAVLRAAALRQTTWP